MIFIIILLIIVASIFLFLKLNPPLETIQNGSSLDGDVQLIRLGNKSSFGQIKIEEVFVNHNVTPAQMKIQESYHPKGFMIPEQFEGQEETEYTFKDLSEVTIKPNTIAAEHFNHIEAGTITEDDTIYGLTLIHNETIYEVMITYRHLGIVYETTFSIE